MSHMFNGCWSFNQHINTDTDAGNEYWVVSSVTDMSSMFNGCSSFNQDISNWNVSSVQDMSSMFMGCNNMTYLDIKDWNVSGIGDTATEATELYSVDFQVPNSISQQRNAGNEPPSDYKLKYLLHDHSDNTYGTTLSDGTTANWNIVTSTTSSHTTSSNAVLTASNLKDGLTNPNLISDIDFTINDGNTGGKHYHSYSAVQNTNTTDDYSVGSDILYAFHQANSTDPSDSNVPIPFKFTNLPRGSYKLRIFSQIVSNGIGVPNHTVYTYNNQNETTYNGSESEAYVTFNNQDHTGLTFSSTNSNEIGWTAQYDSLNNSQGVTVFGGVQLQRTYNVSKFKNMFKNSAWQDSDSATASVRDTINSAWTGKNVKWYKHDARLF